jgi:hypothetical protein
MRRAASVFVCNFFRGIHESTNSFHLNAGGSRELPQTRPAQRRSSFATALLWVMTRRRRLVVSVTGEAGTDQLLVEFNEPVYTTNGGSGNLVTGDFSYQDNNATGASSITAMFEANGADRILVLTTNANLIAGDNGDRVDVSREFSIYDAAGNALAATEQS